MTECEREPRVVHEWRERGAAYRLRMITSGGAAGQLAREVFTAGQWAFDQWARLDARELARLAARCKRLEEALGCVLDLDKLLGDTVLHHPKRNEWEQAYKGACREARAALEDK